MIATDRMQGRIWFVTGMMAVAMLAIVVQLVRVQFGTFAPIFATAAQIGKGIVEKVYPDRGQIFDRHGRLIATTTTAYYLEVEIRQLTIQSKKDIPIVLAELLELEADDLERQILIAEAGSDVVRTRLTQPAEDGRRFPILIDGNNKVVLTLLIEDEKGPDLSGLDLAPKQKRVYPSGPLTGHILGIVNQEGIGYFGVEGAYDDWLVGKPTEIQEVDIPLDVTSNPEPQAGSSLVLTIDLAIQYVAAQALDRAIQVTDADSGQVIVMDPRNGELLAIVAWPPLDPTQYDQWLIEGEEETPVIGPAVSGQFEPGSTFKVLVMAAALEENVVEPDDIFIDTGEIEIGGHVIRNWDGEAWGPQDMVGCLQYSLNVCLADVGANKLGAGRFYDALEAFGIGSLTNIDLDGEVSGKLRTHRDPYWTESDLGTNSFGQGVSVTPIQLITAVSAIANDGEMMQPHIVRQVVGPQGSYYPKPTLIGRPLSFETTDTLNEMLAEALIKEGSLALVSGYNLAGKTGTASIPTEYGYDPRQTIATFVGWGPMEDPRFIIFVRLDKPKTSPWGSVVAAPVFREVAERLVVLLEIPPVDVLQRIAGQVQGN
ncbi:MAG: hypothetical protein GTO18_12275 [Anaerolineales bacterium]|nr:hypothetical protein [Anaerolineales bacterium]